jgi:threonine synthase
VTPLTKLDNLYFKREDLNQTGSAKDRSLSLQVKNLIDKGYTKAVISSTGNAAISALFYCQQNNIDLTIFVSPKINPKKLELIKKSTQNIFTSLKPISDAIKFSKKENAYLLRQSTDPVALIGYQEIGKEIISQLPQITSIFIPVGSGTTLLGISQSLNPNVKIFAIQPASNCPISKLFDSNFIPENNSITDAISVQFLPLKNQIIKAIKDSSGTGLVIQNQEIIDADQKLASQNILTSPEGAMCLAGYFKAIKNNLEVVEYPVILLTGAKR